MKKEEVLEEGELEEGELPVRSQGKDQDNKFNEAPQLSDLKERETPTMKHTHDEGKRKSQFRTEDYWGTDELIQSRKGERWDDDYEEELEHLRKRERERANTEEDKDGKKRRGGSEYNKESKYDKKEKKKEKKVKGDKKERKDEKGSPISHGHHDSTHKEKKEKKSKKDKKDKKERKEKEKTKEKRDKADEVQKAEGREEPKSSLIRTNSEDDHADSNKKEFKMIFKVSLAKKERADEKDLNDVDSTTPPEQLDNAQGADSTMKMEVSSPKTEEQELNEKEKEEKKEKLSNREKEREKGKEKQKEKEREREREREREKEKDKEKKDRERERERDRERERERDRERERERERRERERNREREREREKGRSDRTKMELEEKEKRRRESDRERSKETLQDSKKRKSTPDSPPNDKKSDDEVDEKTRQQLEEKLKNSLAAEEEDVEKLNEMRRKRRLEILAKYNKEGANSAVVVPSATQEQNTHKNEPSQQPPSLESSSSQTAPAAAQPPAQGKASADNSKANEDEEDEDETVSVNAVVEVDAPEAKDEDEDNEIVINAFQEQTKVAEAATTSPPFSSEAYNELATEEPKNHNNEEFNLFSRTPTGISIINISKGATMHSSATNDNPALSENWDDSKGYYRFVIGEMIYQYQIFATYGKGVFSTVLGARDTSKNNEEVAIKIIRNNEEMYRTGVKEREFYKKINSNDPDNKRHCVRLLGDFEFRNHLCFVLEPMHMNLREVIKKYGKEVGINISAVKVYAKQLFIALKHLRHCSVVHADIKPDNIVVNKTKTVLKLCDFGSASTPAEMSITPYLQSRFYRAPEVILGHSCDYGIDMWSVGCTLAELYTGKILFPGRTNNDMLKMFMEIKGKFPKKVIKKSLFSSTYFDQDYNFLRMEEDVLTKKTVVKVDRVSNPVKDLLNLLNPSYSSSSLSSSSSSLKGNDEELKELLKLKDLLEKIFMLDPSKRITVTQALTHPFIVSK